MKTIKQLLDNSLVVAIIVVMIALAVAVIEHFLLSAFCADYVSFEFGLKIMTLEYTGFFFTLIIAAILISR